MINAPYKCYFLNLFSVFNIDGSIQSMEIKNDNTDKRKRGLGYI